MTNANLLFGILDHLLIHVDTSLDAGGLALSLGASRTEIGQALMHLDRKGLVNAAQIKLTMMGLNAATALRASRVSLAA